MTCWGEGKMRKDPIEGRKKKNSFQKKRSRAGVVKRGFRKKPKEKKRLVKKKILSGRFLGLP